MVLTEREKTILRLKAEGISDYRIARKLKIETPNVTRSRKNALRKLERARVDLEFIDELKSHGPTKDNSRLTYDYGFFNIENRIQNF